MTTYQQFCHHYGYDPDALDSRREYHEHQEQLAILHGAIARQTEECDGEPMEMEG